MNTFFPIGELIDRYCIAKLKFERTSGLNQLELAFYQKQISNLDLKKITQEMTDLYNIHTEIWNLELLLRSGLEEQVSLDEIGRRAIEIRNWNGKRVVLKNTIAEILSDPVREIKKDHLSQ